MPLRVPWTVPDAFPLRNKILQGQGKPIPGLVDSLQSPLEEDVEQGRPEGRVVGNGRYELLGWHPIMGVQDNAASG